MTLDEKSRQIAHWRRLGHGLYRVTFVIEGYDEEFTVILPGYITHNFAEHAGRLELARRLRVRAKLIIHKETIKET